MQAIESDGSMRFGNKYRQPNTPSEPHITVLGTIQSFISRANTTTRPAPAEPALQSDFAL